MIGLGREKRRAKLVKKVSGCAGGLNDRKGQWE